MAVSIAIFHPRWDVESARQAGLQAKQLCRAEKASDGDSPSRTAAITSLNELADLIRR